MASQAVTTRLGVSGQYEASWCQATRLESLGSLANRWLWRRDHGVAQQVRDDVDDAGLGDDVPDAAAVLVPVDDLVVVPARGQGLGQQLVDVAPDLSDLGRREDVDGEQVTHLVVPANLPSRKHPRLLNPQRDEPKITIQIRKGVGVLRRHEGFLVLRGLGRRQFHGCLRLSSASRAPKHRRRPGR